MIDAQLDRKRDIDGRLERDRKVYELEVRSPKRTLAPGEAVTVNEAVTDVPRSAKVAEIGWSPS